MSIHHGMVNSERKFPPFSFKRGRQVASKVPEELQILHVADVHLGKRQYNLQERELDFYNAFEKSIEIALRERVDAYVVAGDLFDTPVPYTSLQPLRVAVSGFRKLRERGIEVILLPGDHDKPKARGVPSIEFEAK